MKPWLYFATLAWGLGVNAAGAADNARTFTANDLNSLARISDPQVSPNGRYVVYVQRETDFEANRGRNDLWLVDLEADTPKPRRLTQNSANDTHPRWSVDSGNIYFLSSRTGSTQVWRLPMAGGEAVQITDYPLDVGGFKFSSGGGRLALAMDVFPDCADLKCTRTRLDAAAANRSSARSFDSLFIRHWDTWRDHTRSNLFVAAVNADGRAGTPVNVSRALEADVPSKPDGGDEEYTFTPDGTRVVFSARVAGREEPWSTNFDLYEAPSDGGAAPRNLTADNKAWDTQPVFLKNGDLAWLAMKRAGFEADRFAIRLRHGDAVRDIAPQWDRSVIHLDVARDGKTLLVTANDIGQTPLFSIDAASGRATNLSGPGTVAEFSPAGKGNVVAWHDLGTPPDLYLVTPKGERRRLTNANADKLKECGDYWKVDVRYQEFNDVLNDSKVDAVHINSPIADHAQMSVKALSAGKHVACTVPMGTSVEECRQIVEAQRKSGKVYMMMETVVYSREYLFAKELYDSKAFLYRLVKEMSSTRTVP